MLTSGAGDARVSLVLEVVTFESAVTLVVLLLGRVTLSLVLFMSGVVVLLMFPSTVPLQAVSVALVPDAVPLHVVFVPLLAVVLSTGGSGTAKGVTSTGSTAAMT